MSFCTLTDGSVAYVSEIRHGAGTGLREILKSHGIGGGKLIDSTLDEVVAPVRETCAQTLGVALKHMNERGVKHTVDTLLKLLTEEQWEVRHGGLLGIKYALAVRQVWTELIRQAPLQYVVAAACPWMGAWLCLMMQPSRMPIDLNMLLEVKAKSKEKTCGKLRQGLNQVKEVIQEYIAGADTISEDPATRDYFVMRARMMAAKLLGALCHCICDPGVNALSQEIKPSESLAQLLLFHLNSKSALQRIAVALVLCEWRVLHKDCKAVSSAVQPRLLAILSEHLYYDEIAIPFTRMQNECKQLMALLADANLDVSNRVNCSVFTIDQANELVTTIFSESTAAINLKSKPFEQLDSKRQQVQMTVMETNQEWQMLHLRVHMFTACAIVNLQLLPDKLNPVIKPLMEAVKKEDNTLVQSYAATFIARLLQQCIPRTPCPNPKILKNLCSSVCVDPLVTPTAGCPVPAPISQENSKGKITL
ncbi:UNVERIFIED_CONTAM: hypothetical protein FKN15_052346 [Acipenser sinensis]